jgi:hypothetical protein
MGEEEERRGTVTEPYHQEINCAINPYRLI